MQLASLLKVPRLLAPPTEFQKSLRLGCRKGQEGTGLEDEAGKVVLSCPSGGRAECKSASITYKLLPQAAAIEHLLTHFNIDPKEIPTFSFFFFLKCKKLSAALERGSLDRPFNAKKKGAADGA